MNNTVGIIGSGMIGSQVARLAVAAGLNVTICNSRGPETLADIVAELGPGVRAASLPEVAESTDLLVLAVPFAVYAKLPADLLAGKILVDTLNYYPERDGVMQEVKTDTISTSELVQAHLSRSYVVRAINNMDFIRLLSRARPAGSEDRSALPVASDHANAKAAVIEFLDRIGYDVVDMGPLSESWRSEPTMPVYVNPYWGIKTQYESGPNDVSSFMSAPGRAVGKNEVTELLGKAVRHEKMFGLLGNFDVTSTRK
ncbi:NADPH-dependent F420 reductase [Burkholderia catarinensis]|uniref:NADPH-dependent F420 reductase n=1 Tax=Burkholderia catarinensis TaxID=1108140 RepID=UPI00091B78F3|nr:NAD(P)-binding domain-containing protein [Burkholderia catarinensis]KAG8152946.1 F420-dependent NADP oxidoreductase [Burkholderia catarinensis]